MWFSVARKSTTETQSHGEKTGKFFSVRRRFHGFFCLHYPSIPLVTIACSRRSCPYFASLDLELLVEPRIGWTGIRHLEGIASSAGGGKRLAGVAGSVRQRGRRPDTGRKLPGRRVARGGRGPELAAGVDGAGSALRGGDQSVLGSARGADRVCGETFTLMQSDTIRKSNTETRSHRERTERGSLRDSVSPW